MRIAYLGLKGLPSRSGADRVAEAIVGRLAGRHRLTVYCDARYTPRDAAVPGVQLIRIRTLPGKHLQPVSLFLCSALHALFAGNYDIVHVHNVEACFILPLLRLRYRIIATSHGSPIRAARQKWGRVARALMGLTEWPFLRLAHCATSVSQGDVEYFASRYRRRVLYVPNGVGQLPAAEAAGRSMLRDIGVEPGRYILFAAGRIEPTKGCHLVLEAFAHLETDMKLLVVGDLGQVAEYEARLRRMADGRTVFVPLVHEQERLFSIVRSCHLFVFPSTVEAMSMMLLEVAALGMPLVCSDIPDNKYVLGERAVYFRSGDVGDLACKMRWALAHPDLMRSYASEAQTWVRGKYSWDAIAQQYEALYQAHARHVGLAQARWQEGHS